MVSHHPQGHPKSKIYQKELYYRLNICQLDFAHKIKTRWSAMDGQPPSLGWSSSIPRVVIHHQNLPEGIVLQTWNFAPWLNSSPCGGPLRTCNPSTARLELSPKKHDYNPWWTSKWSHTRILGGTVAFLWHLLRVMIAFFCHSRFLVFMNLCECQKIANVTQSGC